MSARYPITPEYLDDLPNNLVRIYRSLETKLIEEICSRLNLTGKANEVVLNDIRTLRQMGLPQERIDELLKQHAKLGQAELDKIYSDAIERNQKYYTELLTKADITAPQIAFTLDRAMETAEVIKRQTQEQFENLTRTTAIRLQVHGRQELVSPQGAFYRILDDAQAQIQSGGISYNQSIKEAVKQLADSGVRVVEYDSGHIDQLDVAVRRAILSGVGQMCDKYDDLSAERLKTDYFEISAHAGARDVPGPSPWSSHKEWQGKVYSIRTGDKYPNIYSVCGLGYVDGLRGPNCRHRKFSFVDGVSDRTYTDEQLKHIDDDRDFDFEGKHYSAYAATQKQREIERTIRNLKRRKAASKAAGLTEDEQAVSIRMRRLNAEYKAFCKAGGLREQPERMAIYYENVKASKIVETPAIYDTMKKTNSGGDSVQTIGKIDVEKYRLVSDNIRTDEVIITDERIQHIRDRHPNDFERYSQYLRGFGRMCG